jgi:tetratricopeptide (TPR) repeat protein
MRHEEPQETAFFKGVGQEIAAVVSGLKISWGPSITTLFMILVVLAFWYLLWRFSDWSPSLFISLSLASFMVGAVAGFLFTSYGDEAATVGKVRDWLIGGLTGLTVAKFSSLKSLLLTFASGQGPQPFALTVGVALTFAVLGFFAMFLQRELILNVMLAQSRDRRGRLDGTKTAGIVSLQLLGLLPPSVLAGLEDVTEDSDLNSNPETQRLRDCLQSDDVKKFLQQCDDASTNGSPLDWDTVLRAAMLNYYLIYFVDAAKKDAQRRKALDWLQRALLMNPSHADLTAKYADVLEATGSLNEAVTTLERLNKSSEAPAYVQQWLGYYLIKQARYEEAVRYSDDYHARFPDDANSLYNAANGLARLRTEFLAAPDGASMPALTKAEQLRTQVISRLRQALRLEVDGKLEEAKKWLRESPAFAGLREDAEFKALTAAVEEKAAG